MAIQFAGEEIRQGAFCRKYSIDGAGLEHRGGHFWVSKQDEHVVEFEIDQPNEPGFDDVRIVLENVDQMDHETWNTFVKD